jgi:indole-3-acetate monooxygenase
MADMADRARLQLASSHVPIAAAGAVDLIHSLVGTAGIRNAHVFQRHFRDVHVITQHAFVSESRMEAVGQISFGLEPNWGFLHF